MRAWLQELWEFLKVGAMMGMTAGMGVLGCSVTVLIVTVPFAVAAVVIRWMWHHL